MMETKEKILNSALKLFAKQGIDKTSTAQISKTAGIATGTLFIHFKTKQELVNSLYLKVKENIFSGLTNFLHEKATAKKSIKLLSREIINHFLTNYDELVFSRLVESSPIIETKIRAAAKEKYKFLIEMIEYWSKNEEIKNSDIRLLQNIIWSMIITIVEYYRDNKISKVKERHLDLIWEAIRK